MAPKIIWRYRRKRHSSSAASSRKQERGFGTVESQAAGGQQIQRQEQKDHQTRAQFAEEAAAQPKVQFQEEEEAAQAKVQFQEEEEAAQAKVQFQEEEEEAQTRVQLQEEEEAPAQPKPEPISRRSSRLIRSVAKSGFKGNPGSYPFQHRIQAAFGRHDISNLKAFNDAAAKQANRRLSSLAYASREKVAFRGYPDLHTAAHEAAHIIQQRRGVRLKDGAGRKGDPYERHADAVADRVVQGKPVETLLNRSPGSDGSAGGALQFKDTPDGRSSYSARGCAMDVYGRREKADTRSLDQQDPEGMSARTAQRGAFTETDRKVGEPKKITTFESQRLDKDEAPMDTMAAVSEQHEDIWDVEAIRTVLFDDGPRFDDIIQSRIDSCFLLTVLLSLTNSKKGLATIREIVSESPDGFLVKFYPILAGAIPDKFRNYHVYVPLIRASFQAGVPLRGPYPLTDTIREWLRGKFAIPPHTTLIGQYYNQVAWVWAIEKAFATVVGDWQHIAGGGSETAFQVLLGKMRRARVPKSAKDRSGVQFFRNLYQNFKSGVPMTVTPRDGHEIPQSFTHSYHVVAADDSGVAVVADCEHPVDPERLDWPTFLWLSGKAKVKSSPQGTGRTVDNNKTDILAVWDVGGIVYGSWKPTVNFDGRHFILTGHGYSIIEVTGKTVSLDEPYGYFSLDSISHQEFCGLFSLIYGSEEV